MHEPFDRMLQICRRVETPKGAKPGKRGPLERVLDGVVLLNSERNKFVYLSCLERELFSVGDVFYSRTTAEEQPTDNAQKLAFYKNFEKNLKINLIKQRLGATHANRDEEAPGTASAGSSATKFIESTLEKFEHYIKRHISFVSGVGTGTAEKEPPKKAKYRAKARRLSITDIKGIQRRFRLRSVILFNKKRK